MIEYIVEGEPPFAGSAPFNEAALGAIAARALDGTTNLASSITNHAAIDSGDGWRERLGEVSAPTLVIHGTEDPIYPYGNAGLRWGRRLLAPGCSLWSGWARRCLLGLCGTLSSPPSYATRRFAVNAARDTNVDRSVVRSADGRGAFRHARIAAPDRHDGAAWQPASSGLGDSHFDERRTSESSGDDCAIS